MSRTRVLRVIARMNVGGPAWQVTALTERLDPAAYETRLVTGHVGPGEADYLELRAPHLPVRRIEGLGRAVRATDDARALASLVGEVRRFRPHIVHTHTAKAGVLGRLAARACRVPYVVHTFHGHLLHGYFSPPVTAAVRQTERALARATTRLVAVGEKVRDDLLAAGIGRPAQYEVVPPGVDLALAPPKAAARERLGLPAEGPVVAFVGRLTAVKRPERFVDVAAGVAPGRPDATFAVVGEGPLLEPLRARAAGLGDRVRFLGWRSDVETVYAAADVVVLTSDNEGMPVSLIEAASVGRPAVTTAVGSAAEVVAHGETGFVTSTDVGDIMGAVRTLLDDPALRERFGTAAAERASARFGVGRLVADVERIYASMLAPCDRR